MCLKIFYCEILQFMNTESPADTLPLSLATLMIRSTEGNAESDSNNKEKIQSKI